jgi:hypothetical protein
MFMRNEWLLHGNLTVIRNGKIKEISVMVMQLALSLADSWQI